MTRTTADREVIAKAIHLACRAPSLHNSQPWRWIVGEAAVDLFADHERVVRSADSSGREAIISCGAASSMPVPPTMASILLSEEKTNSVKYRPGCVMVFRSAPVLKSKSLTSLSVIMPSLDEKAPPTMPTAAN